MFVDRVQVCFLRGSSQLLSPHPDPNNIEAPFLGPHNIAGLAFGTEGFLCQEFHIDAKYYRGEGLWHPTQGWITPLPRSPILARSLLRSHVDVITCC